MICYHIRELNKESVPFVPVGMERIIGKQVKGLYDLVTVCNERTLCVRKGQSLAKAGKTKVRDDLRVRRPADCWYGSIVEVFQITRN